MTDRNDELGRVLGSLLHEEADTMQTDIPAASQRLQRELTTSRRHRQVTAALTGLAAVAAVLGLVLWNQSSTPPPTGPAEQPKETGGPAAPPPYFLDLSSGARTSLPEELVPDPVSGLRTTYSHDGTAAALECAPGVCGALVPLSILRADGSVTEVPVPGDSSASVLAWSSDGTMLAYRQAPSSFELGDLFVYDLDRGVSTQLTDLGLGHVYWVDMRAEFSPDGETVVFHRPRGSTQASKLDVWTVPVTGGQPRLVVRDAAQPEFLPDGTGIAVVRPDDTSLTGRSVEVVAGGRPPRPLFEAPEEIVDYQFSPDGTRALISGDAWQMVDIGTGEVSDVAVPGQWAGNDTFLVTPES